MAVADIALTYLAMSDGDHADHVIDLARFVAFGLIFFVVTIADFLRFAGVL